MASELLTWAQGLHDEPHHHRCNVNSGGECDCYRTTRPEYGMAEEALALAAKFRQACMNLATARPLDVMKPHEDLSLGECQERWMEFVHEQVLASVRSRSGESLRTDGKTGTPRKTRGTA